MTDNRLHRVVEALSDGELIDWASVRRRFSHHAAVDCCTHLETVSRIGRLADDKDDHREDVREPAWVSLLLAVAIVQIALGIIASVAYREPSFVNTLRLLTALSFAGMGLVLRWSRGNPRARDLGAVFLLLALGFSRRPYMLLVDDWLSASTLGSFLGSGLAVDAWAPFFIWHFARRFPATLRFTRVDRAAIALTKVAGVVGTLLFAVNLWAAIAPAAGLLSTFAFTYDGGRRYSATIFILTLPALPVIFMRGRSAPPHEQDRVRFFTLAMVVGIAPTYIEVILEALSPRYRAFLGVSRVALTVMVTSVLVPLLALPLVTAYSVLVHRLLDVRVVIRQGVRYLLARWTLAVLTAMPFAMLASHVYTRRNESIAVVITGGRGAVLLSLALLGCTLLMGRAFLVAMLDRWFDRRDADRSMVLARAGERFRLLRTRAELVSAVAEAAESALNASAVVYLFDSRQDAYVPFGRGGLPLSADSALAAILAAESSIPALVTRGEESIWRFLPRAERMWLDETQASLVAPIRAAGTDRPAGVIAFGPRGDAIGYSRDDERFGSALASATGMALENLRLKTEATGEDGDQFALLCARCRLVVDGTGGSSCDCGGTLHPASVPRRINGRFLVEALLGAGGMGVAYLARDIALNRQVAIKTLPSVSADAMSRLRREAQTMAALSHPNLATILGHESWRGTPILVCEYLPGGTLEQRMAGGPLPVDAALTFGLTLLDALEYMHERGVLHRDIKPSNIAFAGDGTPKLLDFGLASLVAPTAPATGLAGTLPYLPPQAFEGGTPTVQFDLWALAVVLFETIVGHHPFAAGANTTANICRGRFVVRPETAPEVSPAVGAFLRSAMSPARQFASSATMRAALIAARVAYNQESPRHARAD